MALPGFLFSWDFFHGIKQYLSSSRINNDGLIHPELQDADFFRNVILDSHSIPQTYSGSDITRPYFLHFSGQF